LYQTGVCRDERADHRSKCTAERQLRLKRLLLVSSFFIVEFITEAL